ncbi:hypothetical protein C8F04DRAFT_1400246 [Mycena alexandri]|uniref:Uncharacterized protein n=1 Tax=Mycena alexandri TaxID=1745969 RepID=A0AAD6WT07_9AGAR|nr:hypothetical protein C8F04DRAFT_1400246 [Mycena alexandri]
MPSNIVVEAMNKAKMLRTMCKLTPSKNVYLPFTVILVEICTLAAPEARKAAAELVFCAVKKTESLIENGVDPQLPPKVLEGLEKFESGLVAIHSHIESIPEASTKAMKFRLSALAFYLKSKHLQAKSSRVHQALVKLSAKPQSSAFRNEWILEAVSFTTRAAGTLVDIPVLNVLKPVVGMTALICDTAKVVKSNREAAIELAEHAQNVTNSIMERVNATDEDFLEVLHRTLDKIQKFLDALKRRRGGVVLLALGAKDKDQFATLHLALDRALQVLTTSQTTRAVDLVRTNTADLTAVRATVTSVGEDVKRVAVKEIAQGRPPTTAGGGHYLYGGHRPPRRPPRRLHRLSPPPSSPPPSSLLTPSPAPLPSRVHAAIKLPPPSTTRPTRHTATPAHHPDAPARRPDPRPRPY